nr:N-alpha-acetyltransferase 40 isoform X2 [Taeniopygia guttata]
MRAKLLPWKLKACSNSTLSSTVHSSGKGVKLAKSARDFSTSCLCHSSMPSACRARRRKSSKAKEKKQRRLEERAAMAAVCAKVEAANKLQDPLEAFPVFKKYDRNGLNVSIECRRVSGLEPSTLDWAFELTKANMQTLYEQSEWGWKEREKREELRDERAWYLLAREPGHGPVAFSHFRFDVECGDEVLYCTQMKKVMLTVFKHNHGALQFFREALHDRAPRAGGAGAQTEVRGGRHLPQRVRLLRGRFLLRDPEPQHQIRGPPPRGGPLRRLLPLSPPKNSPGPAWRDPRGG